MELLALIVAIFLIRAFFRALTSAPAPSDALAARVPPPHTLPAPPLMRFSTRVVRTRVDEGNKDSAEVFRILVAGPFPVRWPVRGNFVTSVFDVTDEEPRIVLSFFEEAQEPDSIVFQHRMNGTVFRPGYSFVDWVPVGYVIPTILQPPRSGLRKLKVVTRLVDADNPPVIELGFADEMQAGVIWVGMSDITYTFSGKGYLEVAEHEREARKLALQVGVAVAMADGALAESEGGELKRWAEKSIHHLSGELREEQRRELNGALTDAFEKARAGNLHLLPLLKRLKEVGDDKGKYEALDLCFDIMAADGVATSEEMRKLEQIATGLSLDVNEFNALRDKKLLAVGGAISVASGTALSPEQMLGVDPSWDTAKVREHLKAEFRKWNNRLSTLQAGPERDSAQKVLDAIADLRKRHAA